MRDLMWEKRARDREQLRQALDWHFGEFWAPIDTHTHYNSADERQFAQAEGK